MASHDLNKIVSAGYADLFYMRLALVAIKERSSEPYPSCSHHESGILIVDDSGWGRNWIENYKHLNINIATEILSIETAMERFPIFQDTNWDNANQYYWNSENGWAEAGKSLENCLNAARESGVEVI